MGFGKKFTERVLLSRPKKLESGPFSVNEEKRFE